MENIQILVPDTGGSEELQVAEFLVSPGDTVKADQCLMTLEAEKTVYEIPSPADGVIVEIHVDVGDKVVKDDRILTLESRVDRMDKAGHETLENYAGNNLHAEVVVLGAGPGGYTAAFRAADLGKKTMLIERYSTLGGVCLNVGCIPSKALLHTAEIIHETAEMADKGVSFGVPEIDIDALRDNKNKVVTQLTRGLASLTKQRNITHITGQGRFISSHEIEVDSPEGKQIVSFDTAIIAAGSQVAKLPDLPYDDARIMDSTGALELKDIPGRLLILGGGIIGLEMASVYHALGSAVTVAEFQNNLIPGCDADLVQVLKQRIQSQYDNIYLATRVTQVIPGDDGLQVYFDGLEAPESECFDRVLVAVGRRPNGKLIGAEQAGVQVDEAGFIPVDFSQRTNVEHIFAIGDITGNPMLAHKASHEGKIAAEAIAGQSSSFKAKCIPSVAYTDPEISWAGLSHDEARKKGLDVETAVFPWAASGRALGIGRGEGLTKLLFDKHTRQLVGAGIVGKNAGELISEAVLAIEMKATAEVIGQTIHPHPTLSETVCMAAEVAEHTVTDIYLPR